MINGVHIRGARALLGWSATELAKRAQVGTATVQRIEHARHSAHGQCRTIEKIEHTLTEAGVHFIDGPGEEYGVRVGPPVRISNPTK